MAAVLLRAASLAFVMVLGILLKKTGIVEQNAGEVIKKIIDQSDTSGGNHSEFCSDTIDTVILPFSCFFRYGTGHRGNGSWSMDDEKRDTGEKGSLHVGTSGI